MKPTEYKKHIKQVAKRAQQIKGKANQRAVGFPCKVDEFELVGYFHNKRIHKLPLKLSDFSYLRYICETGDTHVVESKIYDDNKILIVKKRK